MRVEGILTSFKKGFKRGKVIFNFLSSCLKILLQEIQ